MKKIFIGIPIHSGKLYCLNDFLYSLSNLDLEGINATFFFVEVSETPSKYLDRRLNEFINSSDRLIFRLTYPIQLLPKIRSPRAMKTQGKNTLIQLFREKEFSKNEFLFFIDSDMLVPPNILQELLQLDADVSSALIKHNYYANVYLLYKQIGFLRFDHIPFSEIFRLHKGAISVDAMSSAVFLVKRHVFNHFKFRFFEGLRFGSHDIIFSMDANFMGFSVKCLTEIEALHLQNAAIYEKMKQEGILSKWMENY